MVRYQRQILPRRKAFQTQNVNAIARLNLVVIRRVSKRQRQHALLLQIRLVDPGERADDDGQTAEVPWLERSVFTRGAFSVVVVPDHDPFDALVPVVGGGLRDGSLFARQLVLDLVGFAILSVDGTDKAVLCDRTVRDRI